MAPPAPWLEALLALGPCDEAWEWAQTRSSWGQLWATATRGDWLAWYLGRISDQTPQAANRLTHQELLVEVTATANAEAGNGCDLLALHRMVEAWEHTLVSDRPVDVGAASSHCVYAAAEVVASCTVPTVDDMLATYAVIARGRHPNPPSP